MTRTTKDTIRRIAPKNSSFPIMIVTRRDSGSCIQRGAVRSLACFLLAAVRFMRFFSFVTASTATLCSCADGSTKEKALISPGFLLTRRIAFFQSCFSF
jgi:hypothetical protein